MVKKLATVKVNLVVGFALVMVHITEAPLERIRKGPAPLNLEVPPYNFVSDDIIKIG